MTTTTTWPRKGFKGKQPFEHDEPPITPAAGLPLLTSGSADPIVHVAFTQLAKLGYDSPIARGENPYGIVGPEEMAVVRAFRSDYSVREDPTGFGGDHDEGRRAADNHIGPWTFEAIRRAAEAQEDGE